MMSALNGISHTGSRAPGLCQHLYTGLELQAVGMAFICDSRYVNATQGRRDDRKRNPRERRTSIWKCRVLVRVGQHAAAEKFSSSGRQLSSKGQRYWDRSKVMNGA